MSNNNNNNNNTKSASLTSVTATEITSHQPSGETTTTACYSFFVMHALIGITMHDVFVYELVSTGLEFWGFQWVLFCVLQASIPIASAVILLWCRPTTTTKLFARPYFSTVAICALVYIFVGSLWICDDRKSSIIIMASVGFVLSMYHWFVIEYLSFKKKNGNDTVSAKPMDDSLEEMA